MADNKTKPTLVKPQDFIETVEHPGRRQDALTLLSLFNQITGMEPEMWGTSIIGYGTYQYTLANGKQGSFMRTGFSPRKQNLSLYIMSGFANNGSLVEKLGKTKQGKSCLYINKLADVDMDVLAALIKADLEVMAGKYPE